MIIPVIENVVGGSVTLYETSYSSGKTATGSEVLMVQ
jgi:hypothetical protein